MQKLDLLKRKQLKQRTLSKVKWAVRAFQEWHGVRLGDKSNVDECIVKANLSDLDNLKEDDLQQVLCMFIPEVTKVKDGGDYPGKTLYEMIIVIQKYLNENQIGWKLIDGADFVNVKTVLDNTMKERVQANIGMVVKQAQFMSTDFETSLWNQGVLGEDNPDKLRATVLFLIGINCGMRAGDEHYDLHRDGPSKKSHISFKCNEAGQHCVVYEEDTITKTNDGGINSLRKDRKIVWINPNVTNVSRCPVRLIDKYISLLPPVKSESSRHNFYLHSMERPNPAQWYTSQVVGLNTLKKTVSELLKNAKLDKFFTNHSLRRSSATHLFQAGVDKKIIREITEHKSDELDKYSVTSDAQRRHVSNVLAGNVNGNPVDNETKLNKDEAKTGQIDKKSGVNNECECSKQVMHREDTPKIGEMIVQIVHCTNRNRNHGITDYKFRSFHVK